MAVFAHIAFARNASGNLVDAHEEFPLVAGQYVCVGCGGALDLHYARKGAVHFAHNAQPDCELGPQQAVHAAALEVLRRSGIIYTPALTPARKRSAKSKKAPSNHVAKKLGPPQEQWDPADAEANVVVDGVALDFVAETLAGRLGVQISVLGLEQPFALDGTQNLTFPVLQIRLAKPTSFTTFQKVKEAVVDDVENKRWLAHPVRNIASAPTPLERRLGWDAAPVPLDGSPSTAARLSVVVPGRDKKADAEIAESNVYRQLPISRKYELIERRMGSTQFAWPPAVHVEVRGGHSFGFDESLWEADTFSRFVQAPGAKNRVFTLQNVLHFLASRYELTPPFTNAESVAIWDYLDELCASGFLVHLGRQRFKPLQGLPAGAKGQATWLMNATLRPRVLREEAYASGLRLSDAQSQNLLDLFNGDGRPSKSVEHFVQVMAQRVKQPLSVVLNFLVRIGVVVRAGEAPRRHAPDSFQLGFEPE